MRNNQKFDLSLIVRGIPQIHIDSLTFPELYKKYGQDFTYTTFCKYVITLRKKEQKTTMKTQSQGKGFSTKHINSNPDTNNQEKKS